MKKNKNQVEEKKEININEVTKLFQSYKVTMDEAKENVEIYKKQILEYADKNPDSFDGRTLSLPNGVKVEVRISEKAKYDENACTLDWLGKAINVGIGDVVSVKIDNKKLAEIKLNKKQLALLREVDYSTEECQIMAVKS